MATLGPDQEAFPDDPVQGDVAPVPEKDASAALGSTSDAGSVLWTSSPAVFLSWFSTASKDARETCRYKASHALVSWL